MATDYPNLTIQIGKRKSELLPCPFCGSIDIDCADAGYKTDVWFVQCNNCCATFPHFDSKEEAITAWNTRTPKERGGEK